MRKLKLFSLLAALVCATTMWGIPTQFNYCYDCYREPAYPTVESPCELGGFQNPFVGYNGTGRDIDNVPEGPWKLEFVDYYNPSSDTYEVEEQVENIVAWNDSYYSGVDKSTFPIFRLYQWNPTTSAFEHACYGVVVAYANESNDVEHATLFISAYDDFGCYLTDIEHTSGDDFYITFDADIKTGLGELTDPTPSTPATSDNVDGIETVMEALVAAGGTTDLIINRTLYKDGFFNTLCLPFSLNASELAASPLAGCQLYSLSDASYDGDRLDLTIAEESTIEAGMPYLIKWTSGSDITSMTFTGVTVTASTGSTVTKGTGNSQVRFVGTIGRSELPAGEENYLFLGSGDNLYYPASDDDTSMKGFRAYFIVNSETSGDVPRHAPARLVIAPKMPTAVENVQGDNVQSTKVIENGQLYIIKNGVKYNAQGKVVK